MSAGYTTATNAPQYETCDHSFEPQARSRFLRGGRYRLWFCKYLIPINFRLPLIFGRGWPKIRGDQKVQVFGWPKIKGDETNSKSFENASLALESYFHYMEIQKWWLVFSLVHSNSPSFCATFQGMRSDLINRTVLLAVLLMYNAVYLHHGWRKFWELTV